MDRSPATPAPAAAYPTLHVLYRAPTETGGELVFSRSFDLETPEKNRRAALQLKKRTRAKVEAFSVHPAGLPARASELLGAHGYTLNIGQVTDDDKRLLDKLVRAGVLIKQKACWPWWHSGTCMKTGWRLANPAEAERSAA